MSLANISDMLNQTASSFQENLGMTAKSSLPAVNGGSALTPSRAVTCYGLMKVASQPF